VLIEILDWQHLAVHHNVAQAVDATLRGRPSPTETRYRGEQGEVRMEQSSLEPVYLEPEAVDRPRGLLSTLYVYAYGVAQNRLRQAAKHLGVPVELVDGLEKASVLLTLRSYYRKRPRVIVDAERRGTPVYVLRANTVTQMQDCLADIFDLQEVERDPLSTAMRETEEAIRRVLNGAKMVELSAQNSYIRRRQHQMVREAQLISHSRGKEPRRRVRILRR
jgi:hypothetical protein